MWLVRGITPQAYRAEWHEFDQVATFASLTPADRHMAWNENLQRLAVDRGDAWKTVYEDWWELPVPIEHFLYDPYYVGTDVVVRPVIGEFVHDFFDEQAGHELFVFIGGIGAGKSFSASLALIYTLYQLSCMRHPQRYLSGFPGCSLSGDAELVLMNASGAGAAQAAKIVYGEVYEKVKKSPYFMRNFEPWPGKGSELLFDKRIRLSPGTSQWRSALGFNMFAFAVDEAAFGIESERADYIRELFQAFNQRRRSRFGRLGWGGLFTSPGSEHSFVELIAEEGDAWDTSILVRRITTWEAKDELKPGSRVFLLDRDPDSVRVLDHDLIFHGFDPDTGLPICQRPNGEMVRARNVEEDHAAA